MPERLGLSGRVPDGSVVFRGVALNDLRYSFDGRTWRQVYGGLSLDQEHETISTWSSVDPLGYREARTTAQWACAETRRRFKADVGTRRYEQVDFVRPMPMTFERWTAPGGGELLPSEPTFRREAVQLHTFQILRLEVSGHLNPGDVAREFRGRGYPVYVDEVEYYFNRLGAAEARVTASTHRIDEDVLRLFYGELPPESQEDRAERERRREESRARAEKAQERALATLRSVVTAEQWEQWEQHNAIDVVGSKGTRYRIREGREGNVYQLDDQGELVFSWCAAPDGEVRDKDGEVAGYLPTPDIVLGQLLALITDEPGFLRTANLYHRFQDVAPPKWSGEHYELWRERHGGRVREWVPF
jgi:hypothetical protein